MVNCNRWAKDLCQLADLGKRTGRYMLALFATDTWLWTDVNSGEEGQQNAIWLVKYRHI